MLKRLFPGLLLLSVAAFADTTPIANCTPFPATFANGTGGPTAVSCPAFTIPGGTVTGVALTYSADYQFGTGATNSVNVTFAPGGPGGVTWTPGSQTLTVTGGASSGAIATGGANATAGVTTAAFAAAFNVNVSSTVTQGGVATSSGAVQIVYTYTPPPALTLACPSSTGTVGVAYSSTLVASGGVPPYGPYSITTGALPGGLTLSLATGAITGIPTAAGVFNFTAQVIDSRGAAAGTATANCSISTLPPPQTGGVCNAATINYVPVPVPADAYMANYAANLQAGDSFINITNAGTENTVAGQLTNICVNVYTFSPDEQMISCCSCQVTPNALHSISVRNALISNTLTPAVPNSVVVKLVASVPGSNNLAQGMRAWGTTLHASQGVAAPTFEQTDKPFVKAGLSPAELSRLTSFCGFIQSNGSGYGICRGCQLGGQGALKQ